MIKAILSDFSQVLLFAKETPYPGGLNKHYEALQSTGEPIDAWQWYRFNDKLAALYKKLNARMPLYIFTSRYIQEAPQIAELVAPCVSGVYSAHKMEIHKSTAEAYQHMASKIAVPVQECLFIDDLAENTNAAAQAGMQVIQYQSNDQLIQELRALLGDAAKDL